MSLLFRRRAIARAVLGDLSPGASADLRVHLRGCQRCRAHYDELVHVAQAMSGGATPAAQERSRLVGAIAEGVSGAPQGRVAVGEGRLRRRRWLGAAFVLAPAAAILLSRARPVAPPTPDVVSDGVILRGAADADAQAPRAMLLIHASRKTGSTSHGPVRLVAELPGSGEGRVSRGDFIQFGVRGLRAPAYVRVVGIDEGGVVHDYVPRAGGVVPHLQPVDAPVALGSSVELAQEHQPGRLRVIAFFSPKAIDEQTVRAAIARLDPRRAAASALDPDPGVVAGLLIVEP